MDPLGVALLQGGGLELGCRPCCTTASRETAQANANVVKRNGRGAGLALVLLRARTWSVEREAQVVLGATQGRSAAERQRQRCADAVRGT